MQVTTRKVRRWALWGLLAFAIASVVVWYASRDKLPKTIFLATAHPGGLYHQFGKRLVSELERRSGSTVTLVSSKGSKENAGHLLSGQVHLAIIQAGSTQHADLAALAPLYDEVMHIIVRRSSKITSIRELSGKRVSIGPEGSGMRITAMRVLSHYGIKQTDLKNNTAFFLSLLTDPKMDAAIVTSGLLNKDVARVMGSGLFDLLPIKDSAALAVKNSLLHPAVVPRGLFGESPVQPPEDISTVATTAYIGIRTDASSQLAKYTLAAVYESYLSKEFSTLMTSRQAALWQELPLHPAAAAYHDPYSGLGLFTNFLESIVALKELLFALGAGLYVLWIRYLRLQKKEEQARRHVMLERLNAFLDDTIRIEHAQMNTENADQLKEYLDEVTRIKLNALNQLTDENLRGDHQFSIFLLQCANLIRKIQGKIALNTQKK